LSLVVGAAVTLDKLSRHLSEHGVSCAAIPAEATQRTVGELIANPSLAERQDVRDALLGLDVVLPDGQAPARFGGENMKDVAGYDTNGCSSAAAAPSAPSPPPSSRSRSTQEVERELT
jgi:glycolate oxidase